MTNPVASRPHIEQIRPELTWRLRQQVLYPQESIIDMMMDEDGEGIHFGAFYNNALIGVVSLFQRGDDFQFRKFAIDASLQNMGMGRELLSYIIDFSKAEGARRLWCNARDTATGFYAKAGFKSTGCQF